MNKTKKILTAGLSALLMTSVFASPLSDTTYGVFNTDADKYMDVLKFSEVEFDKVFGNINISESKGLSAGTAFTFAGLYFGTEYWGNLFDLSNKKSTTVKTTQNEGSETDAGKIGSVEKVINETSNLSFTNNDATYWDRRDIITVLTGIGNLGIKTNFMTIGNASGKTSSQSFIETNDINPPTIIREGTNHTSNVNYQTTVEAGLPLSLGDVDLGLKTGLGFNVNRNTTKDRIQDYNWYNNKKGDLVSETLMLSKSGKYEIRPILGVNIMDFNVSYDGNFGIYANGLKTPSKTKLHAKTYSKTTKKEIKTEDFGAVETRETISADYQTVKSDFYNRIGVDYKKAMDLNEKITLGLKATADVVFETLREGKNNNYTVTNLNVDYTNALDGDNPANPKKGIIETVSKNDRVTTTNVIGFKPQLSLAAQYKMIPSKVTLNVGFHVTPNSSTFTGTNKWNYGNSLFIYESKKTTGNPNNVSTKTTTIEYADGTVISTEEVTEVTERTTTENLNKTDFFYTLSTALSCGATFHMTDNLDFDCRMNVVSKSGISKMLELFNMNMAATFRF